MPITNILVVTGENIQSAGTSYYNVDVSDCQSAIIGLSVDTLSGTYPYLDVTIKTSDEENEDASGRWKTIFKFPRLYSTMIGSGFFLSHEIRNFLSKILVIATIGGTPTSTNFSINARKVL